MVPEEVLRHGSCVCHWMNHCGQHDGGLLLAGSGQMFTFGAGIMRWAPCKLCQLRCDPPGETEVLIPQDKGMDIEQAEVIDGCYQYKGYPKSSGEKQSNSVTLLWCVSARILPHLVVFGVTMAWNELASCKRLRLNSVNHRTTRKMPMVCFSSLSAPRAWESSSWHCLPLWGLRALRWPWSPAWRTRCEKGRWSYHVLGEFSSGCSIMASTKEAIQGVVLQNGEAHGGTPQTLAERTLIPPGESCSNFEGVSLRKGACDLWSKTNLLVGSCSMKWDKVW